MATSETNTALEKGLKTKLRIDLFDNVKALLIIFVVMAHLTDSMLLVNKSHTITTLGVWLNTFAMPAFFFSSGIFAQRSAPSKRRAYRAEKPLFFFLLYLVFYCANTFWKSLFPGGSSVFNPLRTDTLPWYLLVMTIYMLLVPFLDRVRPWIALTASVVLGLLVGFYVKDVNLFAIGRTLVFAPYFIAGFYLTSGRLMKIRERIIPDGSSRRLIRTGATLLFIAWFGILYSLPTKLALTIRWLTTGIHPFAEIVKKYSYPLSSIVMSRLGCYLVGVAITALVFIMMPRGKVFFTYIGQRSLQVYILHAFVYSTMRLLHVESSMLLVTRWWTFSPLLIAPILASVLALPKFPDRWFRNLEKACRQFLRSEEASTG